MKLIYIVTVKYKLNGVNTFQFNSLNDLVEHLSEDEYSESETVFITTTQIPE